MRLARSVSVVALLALVPAVAMAQAQDPVKLAERLNKKAMEDYDLLEFESARQTLQSALNKLREEGQDETRTAARVYVSLGMVYISGFKDRSRGVQQFVEALKIDGTTELDPERATPELQEAFDEARRRVPRSGAKPPPVRKAPPPDETPPPPDETPEVAPGGGLVHNSVDEAKAGQDVNIDATMGADVQATRLFLFYRGGGQEDFLSAPMTKGPRGRWTGQIPGEAVTGKTVQYYLEARDSKNRPVTASGSATSPFLITVIQPERGSGVDEHPLSVKCGKDDPLCDENKKVRDRKRGEEAAKGRGYGRVFFNLMVGTGAGLQLAGNKFDVAYQYHNPDMTHFDAKNASIGYFKPLTVGGTGLALAPLHGALELGVNINARLAISGILRLEATLLNNADSSYACPTPEMPSSPYGCTTKVTIAPAGLARFHYRFLEGRFKPSFHLGVGGGYIRHVLDVTEAGNHGDDPKLTDAGTADFYDKAKIDPKTKPPGKQSQNLVCPAYPDTCYDTIGIGYILGAVGISLYYDLTTWKNGGFGLILDTDLQFAFGDQFGINFDVQAGIGAHFQ